MLDHINLNAIAAPISEESPAGEDLRYTKVYDEIKEARRADDDIPQGDWQRENKNADMDKVIRVALDALTNKTKDFQIAAWLTEALAIEEGAEGVETGLRILTSLLSQFWDTAYPLVEDDDFDYRIAPFEFLNERLTTAIRMVPLTDPRTSLGYSFSKWKESRDVGYEADARGDRRAEMIAEGKLPAEEFDLAVSKSSAAFYKSLADTIANCSAAFAELDAAIDGKFGNHAPRVSEIGQILEECNRIVVKICREQKGLKDAFEATPEVIQGGMTSDNSSPGYSSTDQSGQAAPGAAFPVATLGGSEATQEAALWDEALRIMQAGSLKESLNLLLLAARSQPSERGRSRYRFLVAKLCLRAGRPDLAKPLVEQLYTMISEFHLESWESPAWIAEVIESLYQCLTSAEYADEDPARAQELFRKICTIDVTKALGK
ncbi:MAG TPA: type VI secretion system protein TssA [Desulfuromonadales bacterium]|nr:type VI secretion system protein TssA [Desulfuromonadales bacterium]